MGTTKVADIEFIIIPIAVAIQSRSCCKRTVMFLANFRNCLTILKALKGDVNGRIYY
jgi:hypothetical protein